MTAISPLQSIHKKGLFGDHHKKDERKLLNISEVKYLINQALFFCDDFQKDPFYE